MRGARSAFRGRPGFTLIELMVAVLIVAILARIAIPTYHDMLLRARAAEVQGLIHQVRVAVYEYHADTNGWPPDYNPGQTPEELAPYLGEGFSFDREGYQLDWENWILPDGSPGHPDTGVLLGISLTTEDERLGAALVGMLGETTAHYTLGNNYTFVLEGM